MNKFVIGDRVRCVNQSRFNGKEGTVVSVNYPYEDEPLYHIEWDGESPASLNGGSWTEGALRPVESVLEDQIDTLSERYAELISQKDAALQIAAFTFSYYAQQHFAKGTQESTMKALTNLGLERTMLDALEAD